MNNSTEALTLDQDDDVLTDCVSDRDLEAAGGITAGVAYTSETARTLCGHCVAG